VSTLLSAAIARAKAAGVARVHSAGSVPANPTYPYQVIAVSSLDADTYTLDASFGTRSWRIVVESYARTHDHATHLDELAHDAFLDQRLDVPGWDLGPCLREVGSGVYRDPDDNGVMRVVSTFVTTATRTTTP